MKTFKGKNNEVLGTFLENTDVVVNPTLVGDEPEMTGIQVGGQKYKAPQGGGSGSGSAMAFVPAVGLLDTEAIYDAFASIGTGELLGLGVDLDEVIDYLKDKMDTTISIDQTKNLEIAVCPLSEGTSSNPDNVLCSIRVFPVGTTSWPERAFLDGCMGIRMTGYGDSPALVTENFTLEDLPTLLENTGYNVITFIGFCFSLGIGNVIYLTYTNATTQEVETHIITIDDMKAFANKCIITIAGSF